MQEPTPSPGRSPSRRGLLFWGIALLWAFATAFVAWPMVASLLGPMYRKTKGQFVKVGSVESLPLDQPTKVSFPYTSQDAFLTEQGTREVWVVKHSASELVVFSPVCPHLGCRVAWMAQSKQFVCPCHGSIFAMNGQVLAGPAPRPLDMLPFRVENGQLLIEWEDFEVGIAQKVPV